MAAAEIQVVNPSNLQKIESFLSDPSYKEIIENSSTFNTRLCAERRMRMPFIDTQTGVAQSHSNLFMSRKQRMPGVKEGQLYTYPAQRWRKTRRQYHMMASTRWGWHGLDALESAGDGDNSSGIPGEAFCGDDSRDGSQTAAKDDQKEWGTFYDELGIDEMETCEEPEPDSDEDYYDDTYANRRKRRGGSTPSGPGSRGGRTRKSQPEDTPAKRGRGNRGRKRTTQATLPYEVPGDSEKPYGCELCGAKYKTRAGLTYHYTHTHKEGTSTTPAAGGSDNESRESRALSPSGGKDAATNEYQDSYVSFLNTAPAGTQAAGAAAAATTNTTVPPATASAPAAAPPPRRPSPPPRPASADTSSSDSAHVPLAVTAAAGAAAAAAAGGGGAGGGGAGNVPPGMLPAAVAKEGEPKTAPSPYCDFCLGDERANKKTGVPEELVSCSDCGRSGHPTCLQFTANMIVSVRKYRWQCIECKCCSVCGTSDNDDQLLFCDDCDRGYHMYCLAPPLRAPPEGSWSCSLCIQHFHQ